MKSTATSLRETDTLVRSRVWIDDPIAKSYVEQYLNPEYESTRVFRTTSRSEIKDLQAAEVYNVVNLSRVNDIRRINKFFEAVNHNLPMDGLFVGCFKSKEQQKQNIYNRYPSIMASLYYALHFIWRRIMPKIKLTQKPFFKITKGQNRVLPVPEVLGRLVCCGFEIVDYTEKRDLTYFTVRKVDSPAFDYNPTYGPLISLNRVGFDGEMVKVYKVRTMHSYAEYLQEYVYEQNNVKSGGKFKDDFRITNWGQLLRKFWLDELPMLYNWIRGDLKLIGVRPLSQHYFDLYPKHFKERRLRCKPGLIPPFYADMPDTLDEIFASEKKYIMEYEKHPIRTDIKYLFKSLYNIFIKKARSQ